MLVEHQFLQIQLDHTWSNWPNNWTPRLMPGDPDFSSERKDGLIIRKRWTIFKQIEEKKNFK